MDLKNGGDEVPMLRVARLKSTNGLSRIDVWDVPRPHDERGKRDGLSTTCACDYSKRSFFQRNISGDLWARLRKRHETKARCLILAKPGNQNYQASLKRDGRFVIFDLGSWVAFDTSRGPGTGFCAGGENYCMQRQCAASSCCLAMRKRCADAS